MLNTTSVVWNYSPIDESIYYHYAIPLVCCYAFPFIALDDKRPKRENRNSDHLNFSCLAQALLLVGLVSEILFPVFSKLPIIGALLSYSKLAWYLAIPVYWIDLKRSRLAILLMMLLLFFAWRSTLYWHVYITIAVTILYGLHKQVFKIFPLVLGVVALSIGAITIQAVKNIQRKGEDIALTKVSDLASSLVYQDDSTEGLFFMFFGRLNQGVHDSFVYYQIDSFNKTSNSILKAGIGAILPRYLYSEKPRFSSEKFSDFTGYYGMGYSFITMSGCAEAAANYGLFPGCLFLLFWGAGILPQIIRLMQNRLGDFESILLVIPVYHLIRVEVDFFHWFCGLFYGWIVVVIVRYFLSRIRKVNGLRQRRTDALRVD